MGGDRATGFNFLENKAALDASVITHRLKGLCRWLRGKLLI